MRDVAWVFGYYLCAYFNFFQAQEQRLPASAARHEVGRRLIGQLCEYMSISGAPLQKLAVKAKFFIILISAMRDVAWVFGY